MKKTSILSAALLVAASTFLGCSAVDDVYDGVVNWENENGNLELVNKSNKDIVVFKGQTPAKSSILGGIRAGSTKTFDLSDDFADYSIGGWAILRGITREEFEKYQENLSMARIEFTAMATYKADQKYRIILERDNFGDYGFLVSNTSRLGIELRKDSPNGEKVAYLPALQANQIVYSQTTNIMTLYPVYVYYDRVNKEVTTLNATNVFEQVNVQPQPLANRTSMMTVSLPNDPNKTWETIVNALKSPAAYVKVTNMVANQAVYFTLAAGTRLYSQNGYDGVGSGQTNEVFEVIGSDIPGGTERELIITLYSGTVQVPVLTESGDVPLLENGYDYEVTIRRTGGNGQVAADYTAVIREIGKRDLTDQIESIPPYGLDS